MIINDEQPLHRLQQGLSELENKDTAHHLGNSSSNDWKIIWNRTQVQPLCRYTHHLSIDEDEIHPELAAKMTMRTAAACATAATTTSAADSGHLVVVSHANSHYNYSDGNHATHHSSSHRWKWTTAPHELRVRVRQRQ